MTLIKESTKQCDTCGKIFKIHLSPCRIKENRGKYCSSACKLHHKTSKETKEKMSQTHTKLNIKPWKNKFEQFSANWKGDNVGYRALHMWVDKRLGKPMCCDNCGITSFGRYHWANKSHLYKREITDWIRLCPSCHKKYDMKGGN